jgi:DNA-binding MarR family transcriptional regulator
MPHLPFREIPKYESLMESSKRYPALDPLSTATFLQVLLVGDELFRGASTTFRSFQISKGKFLLMMQLFNKGDGTLNERSPADLAEALNVTRATVTGLLDGLQRDGLIERKQAQTDRRMVQVSLTQSGLGLIDQLLPLHFARIQELMAGIDPSEKEQMRSLLSKLTSHLEVVAPYRPEEDEGCNDCI